jgi:outer membrane receptor protein involved in Fe transport
MFFQRQSDIIEADYEIQGMQNVAEEDISWIAPFGPTISNGNTVYLTRLKRVDRDYAAFGQVDYDIFPSVTLTAGIRGYMYKNTVFGFSGVNSARNLATCQPTDKTDRPCNNTDKKAVDQGSIYKFGAKWQVDPRAMVYATFSRGFRPGGINRNVQIAPYGADSLDNYELGWKTRFGPFTFNGAAFYEKWKGLQYGLIIAGLNGQTSTFNAGDARIYGVEGDLSFRTGGLSLSMAGTYVDAKLTTDFCAIDKDTKQFDCTLDLSAAKGTRLPVTPKFKGNATARYEFPLGASETAFVQVSMLHQSNSRAFLEDSANFFDINDPTRQIPTKGFTSFDLSLGSTWNNFKIEAYVQNVFDKRGQLGRNQYCGSALGTPGEPGYVACSYYSRIYPIKPQLFGLKVGTKF